MEDKLIGREDSKPDFQSLASKVQNVSTQKTLEAGALVLKSDIRSDDTLWLEVAGNAATANLTTGPSTNYSNYQLNSASSGGAQTSIATANRQYNASSDDPGEFANVGNIRFWASAVIAIRPSASSPPSAFTPQISWWD